MKLTRKAIYTTHELLSQRNSIKRTNKQPSVTSLNVSWNSEDKGDSDDNEKMKKADEFFLKIQFTKFFCQQIWFQELFIGCSEFPAPLTVKTGEENFQQYCGYLKYCMFLCRILVFIMFLFTYRHLPSRRAIQERDMERE